jgi:PAS domain S-box-containing protein
MCSQNNQEEKLFKLRKEAEYLLNSKEKGLETSFPDFDYLKLIRELELHQLELEMQNEELNLAKEKAEFAEKKYTELYDFAPSGYLTLSEEGEILELNNNAEHMLGKERSHLINSSFGFFVSEETRAVYNRFLKNIFKGKLEETCELKLDTGQKLIKYIHVNGIVSNSSEKCLITLVDITKSKEVEQELVKAREKAEENERLKMFFLANMSHEIRTPMNGILGFAELLKTLDLNSQEQQKYIGIIEKSGARMLNIINDIISISKIESHQVETIISETNINEQVEFIYSFFKLEAMQKKLDLSYQNALPVNEAFIGTDREKLYAVLTNLVKNAIKFTQSGFIELGYEVKDKFFEFYVKDNGPGIPDEQKTIIFERFRQGSESFKRKYEGSGLGLSISKAYVEMLGGKIWVEDNAGNNGSASGAKFLFTIPRNPKNESKQIMQVEPAGKLTKTLTRKLKILIAEDDKFSELLFVKLAEGYSREFITVQTGVEAIKACRKNPDIDLVLMDINMPEMDGYEATREIRKFNKDVVIIAQTGHALPGDREKSLAAGCNDSITKPINRCDLINMIATCLGSCNQCRDNVNNHVPVKGYGFKMNTSGNNI